MSGRWQFWIDRGGTFTDCIGEDPETGELCVTKVPSDDRAPLTAIRRLLGLSDSAPIPPCDVRMGTTIATNALLERKGHPTVLAVTRGLGDLPWIGTQARPDIFALAIEKPKPLCSEVLEVAARHAADGSVLSRPDATVVAEELRRIRTKGFDSIAVAILHAHQNPELELELGSLAETAGFRHVSLSHRIAPEQGYLARIDTTLVDAYLTPLLARYLSALLAELPGSSLRLMQSSGGLTSAGRFRAPNAILSGPAAGVMAARHVAQLVGRPEAIGFDMGGTSTDVSRVSSALDTRYEHEIAGVRLKAPMLNVHTVAAGGGSVCRFDGRRLRVGPQSTGADPGPLCYGRPRASELTLTDVNLLLGRVVPDRFPVPLERERPRARLQELAREVRAAGFERSPDELAEGFFLVATASMADAIRRVSVARGHDVREHALVVFGGAGGQHACALARRLGMRQVVLHPLAGVLSAWGMGLADVTWHGERDGRATPLAELAAREAELAALDREGLAALAAEGFAPAQVALERSVSLRYQGSEAVLTLPQHADAPLRDRFDQAHRAAFGYDRAGHGIETVALRVEARARARPNTTLRLRPSETVCATRNRTTRLYCDGQWSDAVPVLDRETLTPGARLAGPCLILDDTGTTVVDPGFEVAVAEGGVLIATDTMPRAARPEARLDSEQATAGSGGSEPADPVLLEIMGNLYMSIAEQMGEVLRRTALSTNIRERLDFSCAVFDPEGGLVANAPHIPVHLGAMGESVRAVLAAFPRVDPGDVFATNDPAAGGSHLPDVTVVTPVHDAETNLRFFAACRGHHADIGGVTPGSMPPFSRTLAEEGVLLPTLRIVRRGVLDREGVLRALGAGPHPARDPAQNLADLEAQIAANQTGARLLLEVLERYGMERVERTMRQVQDDAAAKIAEQIAKLPDGRHAFADALDDGTPIAVTLEVHGDRMVIDFAGSGGEVSGNLNAPRAVTVAAVFYFLRTLAGAPIPLNQGCLGPIELRIPKPSVLDPGPRRAVAAGNVETSQRVVDVLLAAAGRAAASQGTMNNLTFGGPGFGYYETIAGGAGAGPDFDGASGVHTHMTNTRITDPEVLEARYPVRLLRFELRRGSGGRGRHRGGDGLVRELELLARLEVSIVSSRRTLAPFGLAGGEAGAPGRNFHNQRELPGSTRFVGEPGDRVRIETPGGGGFGAA